MSTLKKVLALTIVFAMALTFMAGAYTDDSGIDNKSAVDMASALGIIKGYPDGSFGPDKVVTRAEMAKMIYIIKNGKDDGGTYYANAVNPFYDTTSHWAKGYINYCYSLGIIAGKGNGKFDPDAPVTGLEAAKMALTIIGYSAEKAGLVGAQWALNTAALATENGLFDDYGADIAAGAPRQSAAQILYNVIFADIVVWSNDLGGYNKYEVDGVFDETEYLTVGEKYLGLLTETGIITAVDGFALFDADYTAGEDEIILDDDSTYKFAAAKDMIGQNVKVVYKDDADNTVYGVISAGKNTVYNTTVGAISKGVKKPLKFDGKEYNVPDYEVEDVDGDDDLDYPEDAGKYIYTNYNTEVADYFYTENSSGDKTYYFDSLKRNDPVRLVDNNGDGRIDYAFVTEYEFGYIDSMDSKKVDIDGANDTLDLEDDCVYYDGMAEDDYVLFYQDLSNDKYNIVKATSVSAKVSGTTNNQIRLSDSTKIDKSANFGSSIGATSGDIADISNNGNYKIYTDGKYWMGFESTDESVAGTGNYVYVLTAQNKFVDVDGFADKDPKVEVLMPGEDDPVSYVVDSCKYLDGDDLETATLTTFAGGDVDLNDDGDMTDTGEQDNIDVVTDKVFAYSLTSSGKIKLTQDFPEDPETANDAADYSDSTNTIKIDGVSYRINSDSVIFYETDDGFVIYKSGDLDNSVSDADAYVVYAKSGGFNYVKAVAMSGSTTAAEQSGGSTGELYGYVLDYIQGTDEDDDDYIDYTIWNGAKVTIRDYENALIAAKSAVKNSMIAYKLDNNGEVKEDCIEKILDENFFGDGLLGKTQVYGAGQIISHDTDSDLVDIDGTIYKITSDTKIIKIDTDARAGVESVPTNLPETFGPDVGDDIWNIFYVLDDGDDSDELLWIFVDSNKDFFDVTEADIT